MIRSLEDKLNHLREWNDKQKEIWLTLVEGGFVEKNDCDAFILFSSFFEKIVREKGRPPTVVEIGYFIRSLDKDNSS